MKYSYAIFALLAAVISAITSSNAVQIEGIEINTNDPEKFLDAVAKIFPKIYKNIHILSDTIDNNTFDVQNKIRLIDELDNNGKKLQDIARIAYSFDLARIRDRQVKYMLKQVQRWILPDNYGSGPFKANSASVKKLVTSMSIEKYDDYEINYSIKDLDNILKSEDLENLIELRYYWLNERSVLQRSAQENFFNVIETIQRRSKEFNVTAAEYWFPTYSEKIMEQMDAVMHQLKPLYRLIHGYMRHELFQFFGAGVIKPNGPIPADLSDQFYYAIWSDESPFKNVFPDDNLPKYDNILKEEKFDAKKLLELAEVFYESLGFESFPKEFSNKNITAANEVEDYFECPVIVTNAPTLKYCNAVDFLAYTTYHSKLASVHGILLRSGQPRYLSDNNALDDVVGKAISLAAKSAKHLKSIGIGANFEYSNSELININVRKAFEEMLTVSKAYVVAKVLVDLLNGKVEPRSFNEYYWKVWEDYAGQEPPDDRDEYSIDLPYTVYLQLNDHVDVIGKFTNTIWGYQVYRAICTRTNFVLHNCDFYDNKEIGTILKDMLALGRSKSIDDTLKMLVTDYEELDGKALLDYYRPARKWLKNYITTKNIVLGWDHTARVFSAELKTNEYEAAALAKEASKKIYKLYDEIALGLFSNPVDTSDDETTNFWLTSASAVAARELKDISLNAHKYDVSHFKSTELKSAIKQLTKIADVFVLGPETGKLLFTKQGLANITTDKDIIMYNHENNDDADKLSLYPDIQNIFLHSSNDAELKYYWEQWRSRNGNYCKLKLETLFGAFEKAASILEIPVTDFWFKDYHAKIVKQIRQVIAEVQPLYIKLHAYVKLKLGTKYAQIDGAIPDHLVEQVLLQIWTNNSIVEDDFKWDDLLPNNEIVKKQNYDAVKLLYNADDFYKSLGFAGIEEDFWTERLKPQVGSESVTECHATIYDFTPKVYMKYCENVNYKKFLQAHGYLGRIHYALQKKDLPGYFFDSHFLEYPVGEAAILSASTPTHWKTIGVSGIKYSDNLYLNRLIRMGIHTLFKIHKYFVHTKVVADYLRGKVEWDQLNTHYWKLMIKYAGIEPSVDREAYDFDFPFEFYTDIEKNHQLKKFTSDVLGYQIYEALCKLAKHQGELNKCDFSGSLEAGEALKKMMRLGSSKSWNKVLQVLIPDMDKLSASALLKYYEPLSAYMGSRQDLPSYNFKSSKKYV